MPFVSPSIDKLSIDKYSKDELTTEGCICDIKGKETDEGGEQ